MPTAKRIVSQALSRAARSRRPIVRKSYRLSRDLGRAAVNSVTRLQVGWMANLRAARWTDEGLQIAGWAYMRGHGYPTKRPRIRLWLEAADGRTIEVPVSPATDVDANAVARKAQFDYANTAFTALIPVEEILDRAGEEITSGWQLRVSVGNARRTFSGGFKYRNRFASPRYIGVHTFSGDRQILPLWQRRRGLVLYCRRPPVMADEIEVDGRTVRIRVRSDIVPVGAAVVTADHRQPLDLHHDPVLGTWEITGDIEFWLPEPEPLPDGSPAPLPGANTTVGRRFVLLDGEGREHSVQCRLDQDSPQFQPRSQMFAYSGLVGELSLRDAPGMMVVDEFVVEEEPEPHVTVRGRWLGTLDSPSLALVGARQILPADATFHEDGTVEATVDLLTSVWDGPRLPPMRGAYTLRGVDAAGESFRVAAVADVIARTPTTHHLPDFRLKEQIALGRRPRVLIGAPRRDNELGSFHQSRLDARYRTSAHPPQNSVYFESFYGRKATCNPFALDSEIARRHPELIRFWGVVDASVPVPPGAVRVIEGTSEWWDARAKSRYVIANDWLRQKFHHQPFQVVLQTWHGSMLKRIGLDRPEVPSSTRHALETEKAKWDLLLSQNHHSTEIFGSAYAWDKPILEEGYPRNDPLSLITGDAIRARLGIPPDKTVVLYAPTWRDNQTTMVTFLDLARLTADLGDDYVVLLRGHSRTLAYGANVDIPGVIDVTTYPDITELFLAADALVTDYSSVMFDFSVTQRPMIFFVPDMDDYRDSIRGVYFDLEEVAPGPVLYTQDEVTSAIRRMEADKPRYAERYRAWLDRFNAYDDGHSAERVVKRLFEYRPAR